MKDTATPTRQKRRFPDEIWREVEQRACEGVPLQTLSDAYGIGMATLNDRSKRYAWKTPARLARRLKAASREEKNTIAATTIQGQGRDAETALADMSAILIAEIESPPATFQAALAQVAQHAIARGIASVPPPRNIGELRTWADIHRKASGLDAKDPSAGVVLLVNPMRSVSRRPVRVESSQPPTGALHPPKSGGA